jgi:hypothetical protein
MYEARHGEAEGLLKRALTIQEKSPGAVLADQGSKADAEALQFVNWRTRSILTEKIDD